MGKAGQPNSSIKDDYASEGLAAAVQHCLQAAAKGLAGQQQWWMLASPHALALSAESRQL